MGERIVASVDDIASGEGIVVAIDGRSVGVFNVEGRYFAMLNRCPHQGGPLCTGMLTPALDATVDDRGQIREYLDPRRWIVTCPWHGWEWDVQTGECLADPSRHVPTFEAFARDGNVIVATGGRQAARRPRAA